MNPPSMMPSKDLVMKKVARPVSRDWQLATMLQEIIWIGIQLSGPIFLLTSWDGSSAAKKEA